MPLVITEQHGPVRHLVLNRPEKRNAFNGELISEVGDALRAAAADSASHCVVIRGAGPMFSSGMDLAALAELAENPDNLRSFRKVHPRRLERRRGDGQADDLRHPRRLHRRRDGARAGLRPARDGQGRGDRHAGDAIGLIPDVGGSSRLPQVVGLGRAKELVMTGKMINGDEAERIGLVNRTATIDKLGPETQKLIDELLACAPVAVGLAKRVMDASARPRAGATLELEVAIAGDLRALGGLRRGRQGLPGEAPARVQRPLTRPRTSPRPAPRSTASSPSSRNVRVLPSSSAIGSSPFQLSSSRQPRWSFSGRRSCRSRAGRRRAGSRRSTSGGRSAARRSSRAGRRWCGAIVVPLSSSSSADVERPRLLAQGRAAAAGPAARGRCVGSSGERREPVADRRSRTTWR
jgi:enoyl-CoA hydratase/carnithine racemase